MASYLKDHGIEGVLEGIVNDVLAQQPQNPFQAMAERLAAAAKSKGGGSGAPAPSPAPAPAPAAAAGGDDYDAAAERLCAALGAGGVADSLAYAAEAGIGHQVLVDRVFKKLTAAGQIVTESTEVLGYELTPDGEAAAAEGSPEYRVWSKVPAGGISRKDLEVRSPFPRAPRP